ncbi:MAG: hypothetical protein AAGA70_00090 [Pseudomonadota bacterium]
MLYPLQVFGRADVEGSGLLLYLFALPGTLAGVFTAGAVVSAPVFGLGMIIVLWQRERIARGPAKAVAISVVFAASLPWIKLWLLPELAAPIFRETLLLVCAIGAGAVYLCLWLHHQGNASQSAIPPGRTGRK